MMSRLFHHQRLWGAFVILFSLMVVPATGVAQPPEGGLGQNRFSNLTSKQLQQVAEAAGRSKLRPVSIQAKAVGGELRFQVELAPNPAAVRWAIVINSSARNIRREDLKFRKKGYERTITERSRLGRDILTTAVWTREARAPEKLVLPKEPVPVAGDVVSQLTAVDDYLSDFLPRFNASGATIAIAYQGRPIYKRAFGYSDVEKKEPLLPEQTLRIASLSKTFTAVAVLRLVQQRKLSLDDRILPWLEKKGQRLPETGDRRWNDITIRHLLQHSGGWDQSASGDPLFQVVEISALLELKKSASPRHLVRYQMQRPLDFDPGTRTVYNNFGYLLLGRIIEAASGQDYEVAVRNLVLRPAGMENTSLARTAIQLRKSSEPIYHMQTTTWLPPYWTSLEDFSRGDSTFAEDTPEPYGRWKIEVMDSTGAWLSTASDLMKMLIALDREQDPLLAPATIQQMIARPEHQQTSSVWEGLGWSVFSPFREVPSTLEDCFLNRKGALAGTSCVISHHKAGWSFVVLFNCDASSEGKKLSNLISSGLPPVLDGCRLSEE